MSDETELDHEDIKSVRYVSDNGVVAKVRAPNRINAKHLVDNAFKEKYPDAKLFSSAHQTANLDEYRVVSLNTEV